MLSFIGAHFLYLVVAAMSAFAGVMLFVVTEESLLEHRDQAQRTGDTQTSKDRISQ
ncbi:hypothetical protein [Sphingobium boeckii]|uniref:Uncharacterized protein n=1 Tax=Sphingobium boeckii TaxID=1082345 RepID=A0A7W9EGF3_9SPHN|nr:hypothetical protein [Sphingobium boeckii]MBB5686661.1 hypothetical protein [Sphingobium boeckii]